MCICSCGINSERFEHLTDDPQVISALKDVGKVCMTYSSTSLCTYISMIVSYARFALHFFFSKMLISPDKLNNLCIMDKNCY